MLELLRAVPAEKRRTVIFVGRQRNEGTKKLGRLLHDKWEQHGATTVIIPWRYTPQGFAKGVREKNLTPRQAARRVLRIPTDRQLGNFLLKNGITSGIVHFHGTGNAFFREDRPHLTYTPGEPAFGAEISDMFKEDILSEAPPSQLAVEFEFPSILFSNLKQPFPKGNTKEHELITAVRRMKGVLGLKKYATVAQYYLLRPALTPEATRFFVEHLNPEFEEILAHMAKRSNR
ncbi:MAG: hypothetical protein V1708_02470 [Candidatus Micrarchaeota archaeon]